MYKVQPELPDAALRTSSLIAFWTDDVSVFLSLSPSLHRFPPFALGGAQAKFRGKLGDLGWNKGDRYEIASFWRGRRSNRCRHWMFAVLSSSSDRNIKGKYLIAIDYKIIIVESKIKEPRRLSTPAYVCCCRRWSLSTRWKVQIDVNLYGIRSYSIESTKLLHTKWKLSRAVKLWRLYRCGRWYLFKILRFWSFNILFWEKLIILAPFNVTFLRN